MPAFHLSKEEIAALFREKLGVDAPAEAEKLTQIARMKLREEFLAAEMGISGGNFLVAETGTIVTVTNEGNGRMCTTVPPVHVAVVGIDKVVPDWESLTVLLKLLARSATGQKLSCYTQFISGPPRSAAETGPREMHLVLLDNGRARILQTPECRETLLCIRCGACLNICPVYNHVGGYAYGYPISGPTGAIFASQILGPKAAGDAAVCLHAVRGLQRHLPREDPHHADPPAPAPARGRGRRIGRGDGAGLPAVGSAARCARLSGSTWLYRLGSELLKRLQAPFVRDGWMARLPAPLESMDDVTALPGLCRGFPAVVAAPSWAESEARMDRAREDILGKLQAAYSRRPGAPAASIPPTARIAPRRPPGLRPS